MIDLLLVNGSNKNTQSSTIQPYEEIGRIEVHTILTRFAHPEFAAICVNLQGEMVTRFLTSNP